MKKYRIVQKDECTFEVQIEGVRSFPGSRNRVVSPKWYQLATFSTFSEAKQYLSRIKTYGNNGKVLYEDEF
jgi:hypothetical protein